MSALPTGTVTLLFTDIEGSTRLWEEHPQAMRLALARHDALMRNAIHQHDGHVFKTIGDAFCAAFHTAPDALHAALAAQQMLHTDAWPEPVLIKVRMALHTGAVEARDNDYFGQPLNRVARLLSAGHGAQVLLSLPTEQLTRDSLPPSVSLKAMGEHRLRDLNLPETVFQLLHPELRAEFPPLKSLDSLPNNLPRQLTSFIGREKEIAVVTALLNQASLLTLTGSGGCGKTRLALQVAAEVLEAYPDGVWLVELAPLADPGMVPQTVASILGVRESPGEPITKTLLSALKDKQLLLVLDNCEHVLDAAARLVDTILRSCPKLKILVSSREALGIGGENAYLVPSLSLPDLKQPQTPENLSPSEAVRLFMERAKAVKADFTMTHQNAPALASVCHRLDGIPLAIELAAARIRSMTAEELRHRLDDRFRILTGGSRTALPRQQTLRAMIDWSYDLLEENQKALFARLSVFMGGWTLEAAEQVCSGGVVEDWEVLDLLTTLVDKHLILAEEQGAKTRYRLLETVRQYAREKLASEPDGVQYRRQHRDCFLALAEEAKPKLVGPEQVHWLEVLEAEHDNLCQALTYSLEEPEEAEQGLHLGAALQQFWWTRGHLSEGREWLTALLSHPLAQEPTRVRADALNGAGVLARMQGDYVSARAYHQESLALFLEIGDQQGTAGSLSNLGIVASKQSDYSSARVYYEESLTVQREIGNRKGAANSLMNLGNVAWAQGDYTSARSLHKQSQEIFRELGDKQGIALSLMNLGNVANFQGDDANAHPLYQQSQEIFRELGDKQGIANSLIGLGSMALHQRDYASTRSLYEQSLTIQREIGNQEGVASALNNLGLVTSYQGDYVPARAYYEESLAIRRKIGDGSGVAISLMNLGHVATHQGDFASARVSLEEGLSLFQEIGEWRGVALSLDAFAILAVKASNSKQAAVLWGAVEAWREEVGSPLSSNEREEYDRNVAAACAVLGEEAFAKAWAEGRTVPMEKIIDYALEQAQP